MSLCNLLLAQIPGTPSRLAFKSRAVPAASDCTQAHGTHSGRWVEIRPNPGTGCACEVWQASTGTGIWL
jgi:hypothetical protein